MVKPSSIDAKRATATLDDRLAKRLDAYCSKERLSRSQGISRALEYFLDDVQPSSHMSEINLAKRVANS